VYDALHGGPIALAEVMLYNKDNEIIERLRTNKYGLFSVKAEQGAYRITVQKEGYRMLHQNELEKSQTLYAKSCSEETVIKLSEKKYIECGVPLQKNEPLHGLEKKLFSQEVFFAIHAIFGIGVLVAILFLVVYPTIINVAVLAVFILFFMLHRVFVAVPKRGLVAYNDKSPFSNMPVFIKSLENGTMDVRTRTSHSGHFAVVLEAGKYEVIVGQDSSKQQLQMKVPCMRWIGRNIKIEKMK
jgi:hypothetical protein